MVDNVDLCRMFSRRLPVFGKYYCRYIFTPSNLGLDAFEAFCVNRRSDRKQEVVWGAVKRYLKPEFVGLILTEDVKDALAFSETAEDVERTTALCRKYRVRCDELGTPGFHFGPTLLKLCHRTRDTSHALQVFRQMGSNDKDFDFLSSYILIMDLLYESKNYADVISCWENYTSKSEVRYRLPCPRSLQILVLGACYGQVSMYR